MEKKQKSNEELLKMETEMKELQNNYEVPVVIVHLSCTNFTFLVINWIEEEREWSSFNVVSESLRSNSAQLYYLICDGSSGTVFIALVSLVLLSRFYGYLAITSFLCLFVRWLQKELLSLKERLKHEKNSTEMTTAQQVLYSYSSPDISSVFISEQNWRMLLMFYFLRTKQNKLVKTVTVDVHVAVVMLTQVLN